MFAEADRTTPGRTTAALGPVGVYPHPKETINHALADAPSEDEPAPLPASGAREGFADDRAELFCDGRFYGRFHLRGADAFADAYRPGCERDVDRDPTAASAACRMLPPRAGATQGTQRQGRS
jgi:hypothetical protein